MYYNSYMKKLQKIDLSIKEQIMKPNVYALELVCRELSYMYVTSAFSLEEAIMQAKKQIALEFAKSSIIATDFSLRKYVYVSLESLISQNSLINITSGSQKQNKNQLMKQIIEEKNTNLFNKNIKLFTKAEKRMLIAKLLEINNYDTK
ncbi:MAG: hypothetical protein UR41_C0020G0012 [Candidatus Woesebacteria bacterium GW2011_GWA1_33_33]|nr:MAG: hypothetical protein UR41_C0020G0012 [Candidatus Woesebacteria bacterium GW2011_GWA1_33_33]